MTMLDSLDTKTASAQEAPLVEAAIIPVSASKKVSAAALFILRDRRRHNFSSDLVLEKNQHPLVARKPSVHLCDQVVYKASPDVELAVLPMGNELEVQRCLGPDDLLD